MIHQRDTLGTQFQLKKFFSCVCVYTQESLRSLTRGAQQLIHQDLAWEPLEVAPSVALEVFSESR